MRSLLTLLPWLLAMAAAQPPSDDLVIASTKAGPVRAADVAREHEFLSLDERRWRDEEGHAGAEAWTEWTQRVALRAIASSHPGAGSLLEDPALGEAMRRAARQWWLARWNERCYGFPLRSPSDDELRASLQGQEMHTARRLRLSHIFLRTASQEEELAAIAQLRAWREEIRDLDDFRRLAKRSSDSQTALKDGRLGWLRKGWLPEEAERVLYTLAEGTMSEPLALRGGVHLFFVEKSEEARSEITETQIRKARSVSLSQQRRACRQRRLAEVDSSSHRSEGIWPDLEVGGWKISGSLAQELYEEPSTPPSETVELLLEDEGLYQWALQNVQLEEGEKARLVDLEQNILLSALMDDEVSKRRQEPSEEQIRARFEDRRERYRTREELRLEVLRAQIPEGEDPLAFLSCLESASADLESGEISWSAAADRCDGATHESWPSLPLLSIADRASPLVLRQVKQLAEGGITGPIQSAETFFVVGIAESRPPRPLTFEEALPRVRRELDHEQERSLRGQIVQELLSSADFRFTTEGRAYIAAQESSSRHDPDSPTDR